MNYEYYKIFFFVARHKNLTRAAKELFSSQPAVTRIIKNMEAELGCQLFIRGKNGVELTREGRLLYELVEGPCDQLLYADGAFRRSAAHHSGVIHIGATDTAMQCFLFDFLDTFRRAYPYIQIKISTGSSPAMTARLQKGELDLVFNTTPFSHAKALRVIQVYALRDILVGGRSYMGRWDSPVSLHDLLDQPFILLSRNMQFRQFCDTALAEHGIQIDPALEVDSSGQLVALAARDWGLAFVPEAMAVEELSKGTIVKIDLVEAFPCRAVTLVIDPRRTLSSAARLMCGMLVPAE